jgi:hypothetical protein
MAGTPGAPHPGAGKYLPPGRGRPKGTPNKIGALVKQNIIAVFEGIGGTKSMMTWARRNRTEFYKLYARLVPTQVMATVEIRDASEYSDAELARFIASASGAGTAGAQAGESEPHELH